MGPTQTLPDVGIILYGINSIFLLFHVHVAGEGRRGCTGLNQAGRKFVGQIQPPFVGQLESGELILIVILEWELKKKNEEEK